MALPPSGRNGNNHERVAGLFVQRYYYCLNKDPGHLYKFYKAQSQFSFSRDDGFTSMAVGQEQIQDRLMFALSPLNGTRPAMAQWNFMESQESRKGGVLVLVAGLLSGNGITQLFTQSFFLDKQETPQPGYFVLSDFLRYLNPPSAFGGAVMPQMAPMGGGPMMAPHEALLATPLGHVPLVGATGLPPGQPQALVPPMYSSMMHVPALAPQQLAAQQQLGAQQMLMPGSPNGEPTMAAGFHTAHVGHVTQHVATVPLPTHAPATAASAPAAASMTSSAEPGTPHADQPQAGPSAEAGEPQDSSNLPPVVQEECPDDGECEEGAADEAEEVPLEGEGEEEEEEPLPGRGEEEEEEEEEALAESREAEGVTADASAEQASDVAGAAEDDAAESEKATTGMSDPELARFVQDHEDPPVRSWSSVAAKIQQSGGGKLGPSKVQGFAYPATGVLASGFPSLPGASSTSSQQRPQAKAGGKGHSGGSSGSRAGDRDRHTSDRHTSERQVWLWVSRLPTVSDATAATADLAEAKQEVLEAFSSYLKDSGDSSRVVEIDRRDLAQDWASIAVSSQEAADFLVKLSRDRMLTFRSKNLKVEPHRGPYGSGRRGRGGNLGGSSRGSGRGSDAAPHQSNRGDDERSEQGRESYRGAGRAGRRRPRGGGEGRGQGFTPTSAGESGAGGSGRSYK